MSDIRAFASKEAKRLEGPREEDSLRLELLNLKIRRASQELTEFEQGIREKITDELRIHFKAAIGILAARLKMLPRDLAQKAEGMNAQQIFKLASELLYAAFDEARQDFLGPEKAEQKPKVIPFGTNRAVEAVAAV